MMNGKAHPFVKKTEAGLGPYLWPYGLSSLAWKSDLYDASQLSTCRLTRDKQLPKLIRLREVDTLVHLL